MPNGMGIVGRNTRGTDFFMAENEEGVQEREGRLGRETNCILAIKMDPTNQCGGGGGRAPKIKQTGQGRKIGCGAER